MQDGKSQSRLSACLSCDLTGDPTAGNNGNCTDWLRITLNVAKYFPKVSSASRQNRIQTGSAPVRRLGFEKSIGQRVCRCGLKRLFIAPIQRDDLLSLHFRYPLSSFLFPQPHRCGRSFTNSPFHRPLYCLQLISMLSLATWLDFQRRSSSTCIWALLSWLPWSTQVIQTISRYWWDFPFHLQHNHEDSFAGGSPSSVQHLVSLRLPSCGASKADCHVSVTRAEEACANLT